MIAVRLIKGSLSVLPPLCVLAVVGVPVASAKASLRGGA